MVLKIVWDKASISIVKKTNPDGTKVIEEKTLTRGTDVPDGVSDFDRFMLVSIGAAREDGMAAATVRAAEEAANATPPAPVLKPEHAPDLTGATIIPANTKPIDQVVTTDNPTGAVDPTGAVEPTGAAEPTSPLPVPVPRPADNARKDKWEDYAVDLGIDRPRAESMSRPDLIAAVNEEEKKRKATPADKGKA
jgi:hypothetical protein